MMLVTILHSPILHGIVTGALSAAVVDLHAVVGMTNWTELKNYKWSVASFRWFIGAVVGAAAGGGFSLAG